MSSFRKFLQAKAAPFIAMASWLSFIMAFLPATYSAEPKIDFISNITHSASVAIHFTTPQEPTRMYILQYQNLTACPTNTGLCLSNGILWTNWSNLYTGY